MTRRIFLLAFCILGITSGLQAQSPPANPISGRWSGTFDIAGRARDVTLELKFDGKSAVTGSFAGLPNPGEVKSGTFDPRTGILELNLGITGQQGVLIVLTGTMATGVASGKLETENGPGTFQISKTP